MAAKLNPIAKTATDSNDAAPAGHQTSVRFVTVGASKRWTRPSNEPPRADNASPGPPHRSSSILASALANTTLLPQAATARSSQQFSRSQRMTRDSHHTAG
jgi:hypothetical protein